jgi:cysteine desulfurase
LRAVYLDNNATTWVAPQVVEAMMPFLTDHYGNPSSVHRLGAKPAAAVRTARSAVARLLGCADEEVVFTSCGTESDNLAILGALGAAPDKKHIVTTTVEHSAVTNVFRRLESKGYDATYIPVDGDGGIDIGRLERSLTDDTALVSVMLANNETGVLFPIEEIASLVKRRRILLHTDAVTAVGKVPIDLSRLPVDLLAISGHKFHAPKGVGVLFCRKGTPIEPPMLGATQERSLRPGTENVPGIVAMGAACELALQKLDYYDVEVRRLRDRFERALLDAIPDTFVNGARSPRIPNTSNVLFRGVEAHALLVLMDEVGICASAGSACKSKAAQASAVLMAMGLTPKDAAASIRFSLSAWTTDEDIDYAVTEIPKIVARMRRSSGAGNAR